MSALSPVEVIAAAVARLEERGFTIVARNERGDSLYLASACCHSRVRISNHARTPKQRRNHPEVLASLVIRAPCSQVQLARRVDGVIRDFTARADRLERE